MQDDTRESIVRVQEPLHVLREHAVVGLLEEVCRFAHGARELEHVDALHRFVKGHRAGGGPGTEGQHTHAARRGVLPVLWLGSKIGRRQKEVVKQLPDTLDLLTICVEAGLGFDQAVLRVVEKSNNELSQAFNRYYRETQLGIPRRTSLQNMSNRLEVADVTTFTAAIIQATDLGVSMAKILRVQSEQMRVRRRQRAEQEAHRAPIKMLFPMAFLIFPSIFIVLLGPAVLLLLESNVLGTVV